MSKVQHVTEGCTVYIEGYEFTAHDIRVHPAVGDCPAYCRFVGKLTDDPSNDRLRDTMFDGGVYGGNHLLYTWDASLDPPAEPTIDGFATDPDSIARDPEPTRDTSEAMLTYRVWFESGSTVLVNATSKQSAAKQAIDDNPDDSVEYVELIGAEPTRDPSAADPRCNDCY